MDCPVGAAATAVFVAEGNPKLPVDETEPPKPLVPKTLEVVDVGATLV